MTDGVFPIINFTGAVVNSVNVIKNSVAVLSTNINQTTVERALFARYLVHVVGDFRLWKGSSQMNLSSFENLHSVGTKQKLG